MHLIFTTACFLPHNICDGQTIYVVTKFNPAPACATNQYSRNVRTISPHLGGERLCCEKKIWWWNNQRGKWARALKEDDADVWAQLRNLACEN
jgi:hypothetical protein